MLNYFTDSELSCPCCGVVNYDADSKDTLNNAREIANIPFSISSACRCVKHNKEVGGSDTSSHISTDTIKSCAYDIIANDSNSRFKIISALLTAGFNRIGIAKTFIHGDIDTTKTKNVIWVY